MGGVFVAVGLVMPYVVRWAERTRPPGRAVESEISSLITSIYSEPDLGRDVAGPGVTTTA